MEAHARASALNSDATLHIIAMKISRIEKLFASAIFPEFSVNIRFSPMWEKPVE